MDVPLEIGGVNEEDHRLFLYAVEDQSRSLYDPSDGSLEQIFEEFDARSG